MFKIWDLSQKKKVSTRDHFWKTKVSAIYILKASHQALTLVVNLFDGSFPTKLVMKNYINFLSSLGISNSLNKLSVPDFLSYSTLLSISIPFHCHLQFPSVHHSFLPSISFTFLCLHLDTCERIGTVWEELIFVSAISSCTFQPRSLEQWMGNIAPRH